MAIQHKSLGDDFCSSAWASFVIIWLAVLDIFLLVAVGFSCLGPGLDLCCPNAPAEVIFLPQ